MSSEETLPCYGRPGWKQFCQRWFVSWHKSISSFTAKRIPRVPQHDCIPSNRRLAQRWVMEFPSISSFTASLQRPAKPSVIIECYPDLHRKIAFYTYYIFSIVPLSSILHFPTPELCQKSVAFFQSLISNRSCEMKHVITAQYRLENRSYLSKWH